MKYIYHVCCRFETFEKRAYWDTILITVNKINLQNYEATKQYIWDNAGDKIHKDFDKNDMYITSLSYLHEE